MAMEVSTSAASDSKGGTDSHTSVDASNALNVVDEVCVCLFMILHTVFLVPAAAMKHLFLASNFKILHRLLL